MRKTLSNTATPPKRHAICSIETSDHSDMEERLRKLNEVLEQEKKKAEALERKKRKLKRRFMKKQAMKLELEIKVCFQSMCLMLIPSPCY